MIATPARLACPLLPASSCSWVINNIYAPASDGAAAVVHAATVPWGQDRAAAAAINARWAGRGSGSGSRHTSAARPLPDLRVRDASVAWRPGAHSFLGWAGLKQSKHQVVNFLPDPLHLPPWPANPRLQYYARGLFASPLVTSWRGTPRRGAADRLREGAWGLVTLVHSLLDWPLRNLSSECPLPSHRWLCASPHCLNSTARHLLACLPRSAPCSWRRRAAVQRHALRALGAPHL